MLSAVQHEAFDFAVASGTFLTDRADFTSRSLSETLVPVVNGHNSPAGFETRSDRDFIHRAVGQWPRHSYRAHETSIDP